ncbi:glycosyltransferase [Acaryochloris marina]|uniref:Glycosyl transferase, group 2 family protein n=1 Tax=Acaryochloris marina (strain MBIC 11017) TaxID=329726 RepID=B0CGA7_ACAM1|nr:glycosyltransferase [Acaryochloris marina]ABW30660.1 glycosyl transferase, group 2 family protein [Acaryochloris marina MBIC11017]BDM79446.1 rhamnosyltransferase [Acaryochloris marina MBIC10699]
MTLPSPDFISVIVPVFNDTERLAQCLLALEQQTFHQDSYEVIVVDNASEDDVQAVVTHFPHANVVIEPQRGSYAARNTGIAIAKGNILAFTDADCIPAPDWIEKGVQSLHDTPNCGLVAGRIEFSYQNPQQPNPIELCDSVLYLQQDLYLKHAKFGATANVFTFKSVFHKVGLFDQTLKSGGDYEWGQRVFKAGYPQVYSAEAFVHHPARHSFAQLYQKILRTTRGPYDLSQSSTYTLKKFIKDIVRDVFPPFKTFARARVDTVHQKLQLWLVLTFIKHLTALERVKAQLKFG